MKPYRPANGTEGEYFMARFCELCTKIGRDPEMGCPILIATYVYDINDSDYPGQWVQDEKGNPTCTAFDREVTA